MNFITIDTETTGLFPERHGIVSIGAVVTNTAGSELDTFYTVCDPGDVEYAREAMEINKLGPLIGHAPKIEVALRALQDFHARFKVGGELVTVMHNAPFDVGFIAHALRRHQCQYKDVNMFRRTLDTISFGFAAYGEVLSLDKLCERLHIPQVNAHNALNDARATSKAFHYLVEDLRAQ